MGPGWIEVHVHWQRASPPYSERTHKRPASIEIVNCKAIGKAKSEKAIECRSQSHRYEVGKRETVSSYMSSQKVAHQYRDVSCDQKRCP